MIENTTDLKTEFEKPMLKLKNDIQILTVGADLITCENRGEYEILLHQDNQAASFLKQITAYWDGTEENPGPVKAAYKLHKDLSAKKNAFIKPLEAFRTVLGRVSGAYLAKEQEKARQQAAALAKQAIEMGLDTSLLPLEAQKVSAGDGRCMVENWVYVVTDEALIPRKYLILNHKLIQSEVENLKDKTNIGGILPKMIPSVRRTGR